MKRILFNATQSEELRVAIVDGQQLYDLDIEHLNRDQKKSNVYKGVIRRIEPSLEAAFVDYGANRHGFLPLKDATSAYLGNGLPGADRVTIRDALREGQEVIVQVDKEERGTKGAALNTNLSLAGRYLVLMPTTPKAGGVSRKIEGEDRDEVRDLVTQLQVPEGMGVIARTVAIGRSVEELQWDLDHLVELWNSIRASADSNRAPFLIYKEQNVVVRTIRDYLRDDIAEILIDNREIYEEAKSFMEQLLPQSLPKLKLYEDKVPLFTRYQIEHQIEQAYEREVPLQSGGSIVIDHTEALTSIDINSARATQGSNIEETALKTNLEAADEIARQLRLRDLGGLLVIDFIDMVSSRNQKEVENRFRDAVRHDRARVQMGRLSRFGLLEMSRQRLKASLRETSHITCPRCSGQGTIRNIDSLGLQILRLIESEAGKEKTARITAQVPIEIATYLFNEKRDALLELDKKLSSRVILLPNPTLETPHFDIQRIRVQDMNRQISESASYELPQIAADAQEYQGRETTQQPEKAAVAPVRRQAMPVATPVVKKGLLSRIFGGLFHDSEPQAKGGSQHGEAKAAPATNTDKGSTQERPSVRGPGGRTQDSFQDSSRRSAEEQRTSGRPRRNDMQGQGNRRRKPGAQGPRPQTSGPQTPETSPPRAADESNAGQQKSSRGRRSGGRSPDRVPGDDEVTLRPTMQPLVRMPTPLPDDDDPTQLAVSPPGTGADIKLIGDQNGRDADKTSAAADNPGPATLTSELPIETSRLDTIVADNGNGAGDVGLVETSPAGKAIPLEVSRAAAEPLIQPLDAKAPPEEESPESSLTPPGSVAAPNNDQQEQETVDKPDRIRVARTRTEASDQSSLTLIETDPDETKKRALTNSTPAPMARQTVARPAISTIEAALEKKPPLEAGEEDPELVQIETTPDSIHNQ